MCGVILTHPIFRKGIQMEQIDITVYRSAYYLHDYELGMAPILEKSLGIYDVHSRAYIAFGFDYHEESKTLKIPIGLNFEFLTGKLTSDGIIIGKVVNRREEYVTPREISRVAVRFEPRDIYQTEGITFLTDVHAGDKFRSHRLLGLDTGFGKTYCALAAIIKSHKPALISSVNLSVQWHERVLGLTTAKDGKDVVHIKDKVMMQKMMKTPAKYKKVTFFIIGIDALVAGIKGDTELINEFNEMFGIGIQVFDECHEHYIKIIRVLCNVKVEQVYFLSATPERNTPQENKLYSYLFRMNVPSYGEKTHSINKFNILGLSIETRPGFVDMFKVQPKRGVSAIAYFAYIVKNPYYVNMYKQIIAHFVFPTFQATKFDPDTQVVVYVQSLKLITLLKAALEKMPSYKNGFKPTIGDYSGNVDKKVRHLELEHNIIFTTLYNKAGLDLDCLELIINFIPISSPQIVKQIRGRLRSKTAWYIDVVDEGFPKMIIQQERRFISHLKNCKKFVHYIFKDGVAKRTKRSISERQ